MTVKALLFDVIGTVVDYRTTIVREGAALSQEHRIDVDWPAFVAGWRHHERLGQESVERGDWPWTDRDTIHRRGLDELLPAGLSEAVKDDFNRVWDHVDPWPDAVAGLTRLRERFIVAALSNSTLASLVRLSRHGGLPWDLILSADFFKAFKPNRRVYEQAVRLLQLQPAEVMLVAAHVEDLRGARGAGLKTAFVHRPMELGPDGPVEVPDEDFDVVAAKDFLDLADRLRL